MRKQPTYEEYLAKVTLLNMVPRRYKQLCVLDKPDLQDHALNIGVEVTECAFGEKGQKYKRFQNGLLAVLNGQDEKGNLFKGLQKMVAAEPWSKDEEYITGMLGSFVRPSEMTVGQIARFEYKFQPDLDTVYETVERKINKLPGYLENHPEFTECDLFLFADIWLTDEALCKTGDYIFAKCTGHFCYVYILSEGDELFIFNVKDELINRIRYPKELNTMHAEMARQYM